MSRSRDLRRWRAEASCACRRARRANLGDVGKVEQLGQMGEEGVWVSLVVGNMEEENFGEPPLVFNVRSLCSPSV